MNHLEYFSHIPGNSGVFGFQLPKIGFKTLPRVALPLLGNSARGHAPGRAHLNGSPSGKILAKEAKPDMPGSCAFGLIITLLEYDLKLNAPLNPAAKLGHLPARDRR